MFERVTLKEFFNQVTEDATSILFIKEKGCKHCKEAEAILNSILLESSLENIRIFELDITEEPSVVAELALVGVPAFLRVDSHGRKQIKVGVDSKAELTRFITS